jgi:cyclic pyranopterin phosphate synthase
VDTQEEATPKKRTTRKKATPSAVQEEPANVRAEETNEIEQETLVSGETVEPHLTVLSEAAESVEEESDELENPLENFEENESPEAEEHLEDEEDEDEGFEDEDYEAYDDDEVDEIDEESAEDEDGAFDEDEEDYEEEEAPAESGVRLTHLDSEGRPQMVDISAKPATARTAVATGYVRMSKRTLDLLEQQDLPKGDALTVAEVAGIMAAKKTADLIPLCHPIPLTNVTVRCEVTPGGVLIRSEATTLAQTGVEMEALAGASVAALTLYDMCKGVDKNIVIADVRLNSKTGGASGSWQAESAPEYPEAAESNAIPEEPEYEDEEQILPQSVAQPDSSRDRSSYRRESWSENRPATPRPYERDQQRGGYANRSGGYGSGGTYNRDRGAGGSSYGNRPAPGRSSSYGANRDRGTNGGYQGNRDRNPGYNRDRNPGGGYQGNKPSYGGGYQGSGGYQGNRDRTSSYGNRPSGPNRSSGYGNRENTDRGGYQGGYQGNRDRGVGGYPSNKPGFAGFRDRSRDRDHEPDNG